MKTMLRLVILLALLPLAALAQDPADEQYDFLMAKLAADEGRFDEALSRLERVLQKSPADPVLNFERAMILLDAGRVERAESELRRLVEKNPDFHHAHRVLGRVLLDRAGNDRARIEEALRHLQVSLKGDPEDLPTALTVAQILMLFGRHAEAEPLLANLVERAPDQRVLNFKYAELLTKLGRGDESKPYLERAVQLDPTYTIAVLSLADIYQKQGEWLRAAEILAPLIAEDPMNVELQRQQGFFFLRGGESEKARETFQRLVKGDPRDLRALFYLAEALNDLQQYAEADAIYRRLLERTPNDPDLLVSFGLAQVGQRKYDEAERTFQTLLAVEAVPDNLAALARTQLAFIELQRGRHDAAVEAARPVLVFRDKPNGQAINIALEALRRANRFEQALALLEPLAQRFSTDPLIHSRLVEMLHRSGQKEKARSIAAAQARYGTRNVIAAAEAFIQVEEHGAAIALVQEALKGKPDDLDLLFELGSAHERAGDRAGAERAFLSILKSHPDHAATLNYLGYMWADNNVNLDRAADMLTRAVQQEPRNGAYVDSLGWVYFRQGKLDLAEKYLTDATRLLPRDATVHAHLGDVFAKRGDMKRALELYRFALALEPDAKEEEALRTKIAEAERQIQR